MTGLCPKPYILFCPDTKKDAKKVRAQAVFPENCLGRCFFAEQLLLILSTHISCILSRNDVRSGTFSIIANHLTGMTFHRNQC